MEVKQETSRVKHKAYSSGASVVKLSPEILAEGLTVCKEWKLSIDLKLPSRSIAERRKILSVKGINDVNKDSIIPVVWIRPYQSNFMLMVAYNANQTYMYNITKAVNLGNWINLKMSQIAGKQKIKVDNKLVHEKTNSVLKPWTNVSLVTGNFGEQENVSTIVHYRNFEISTCKKQGKIKNLRYPLTDFFLEILAMNTFFMEKITIGPSKSDYSIDASVFDKLAARRAYSINLHGGYQKLDSYFGNDTGVRQACSLQWYNHFYIFGGSIERRQVSMVNGNRLERKGDLDFDFNYGRCTVLNQRTIVLCFPMNDGTPGGTDVCRQSNRPLGSFTDLPNSNYKHRDTRIASYDGKNTIT